MRINRWGNNYMNVLIIIDGTSHNWANSVARFSLYKLFCIKLKAISDLYSFSTSMMLM